MDIFMIGACGIIIAVVVIFFYLLNTARKKVKETTTLGKKQLAPVYLTLADKPDSIIQGMKKLKLDVNKTEKAGDKWRWVPLIIFFVGVGLMAIDGLLLLFGYTSFVFSCGGGLLWVAAIVMARGLRKSDTFDFAPRYDGTSKLLYSLRDDLKPGSTFLGHLDLTGSMLKTKVARSTKDTQNRTTDHFRDEWLALKAKLFDGNILRVSAIQRTKKRQSYWKRSRISGKMKTKPEKFKGSDQQLKVRIVVNPDAYQIVPTKEFRQGTNIGKYTISQLSTDGGMINFVAASPFEEIEHEQILSVLKSAYSLLKRKAS
jgi:hypothetical protein